MAFPSPGPVGGSVTLTVTDVPAPSVPSTVPLLSDAETLSGGNSPVARSLTPGDTTTVPTSLNRNATGQDLSGLYCGGYGVAAGLNLSAGVSGLNLTVGAGHALITGVVELAADTTIALPDNTAHVYIWLQRNGTLTYRTTTAAVTDSVYLGHATTSSGVISNIDYAGVMTVREGTLWRRTNDSGMPTDSPDTSLLFFSRTLGGTYMWDGTAHVRVWEPLEMNSDTIGASDSVMVPSGYSVLLLEDITVAGVLTVAGRMGVIA